MSRSNSKERKGRKYASTKRWVEQQSTGFTANYLKLPKGASLYQPKAGSVLLDILPYEVKKARDDKGGNPNVDEAGLLYWERTFYVHRNVGPNQEAFICLAKTLKKKCPICEERARIMRSDPDEEEEKMAKDLLPKQRQIMNVKDLKNPDKGVQILEMSFFNFGEQLQKELRNAEEEDHWELFYTTDEGKTLKVSWGEDSMGTTKFLRADTIHFKDRKTEYDEDEILAETHDLDSMLLIKDYDELKELFLQESASDKKKSKVKDEDEEDEDDDTDSEDENDSDDEDEKPKKKSAKPSKKSEDSDDDEDDDSDEDDSDDDDEDEKPKKKAKPSKDEEEDEDDEDDSDDSDDDEDEEEEKPAKKKAKPSKDDDDEDDSDSEEDDDSDDDEDEEPKKKSKPAPKKSSKDDDDDDDSDSEEEEEDDDDEEEAPKKSKDKKKSKDDEEEDSDEDDDADDEDFDGFDEEESEDEDEKPKKKKK